MYYILYKTTNLVNEKFYIGIHKTKNIDDDYYGSGKYILHAIKKYGVENFKREILHFCESEEDMKQKEKEIVTKEFLEENKGKTYNLLTGGHGGFYYINDNKLTCISNGKSSSSDMTEVGKYFTDKLKNDLEFRKKFSTNVSEGLKERYKSKKSKWLGRKHKEETKKKISEKNKNKYFGKNNPMFGMIWIHNLTEKLSIRIKSEDLDLYISKGWRKGRKINF